MADNKLHVSDLSYQKSGKKHGYKFNAIREGFKVETTIWADSKEELEKKYQKFIQS